MGRLKRRLTLTWGMNLTRREIEFELRIARNRTVYMAAPHDWWTAAAERLGKNDAEKLFALLAKRAQRRARYATDSEIAGQFLADLFRFAYDESIPDAGPGGRDWLHVASFFVPQSIREPLMGDLREDRKRMAEQGCSARVVFWATISQLSLMLIYRAKDCVTDLILRVVIGAFRNAS